MKSKKNSANFFIFLPQQIAINIIKIYQKTLSPDHGLFKHRHPFGFCRFQPTCSEYAISALESCGFIKGSAKAFWRLLRCNPFCKGGWDPVK